MILVHYPCVCLHYNRVWNKCDWLKCLIKIDLSFIRRGELTWMPTITTTRKTFLRSIVQIHSTWGQEIVSKFDSCKDILSREISNYFILCFSTVFFLCWFDTRMNRLIRYVYSQKSFDFVLNFIHTRTHTHMQIDSFENETREEEEKKPK